MKIYFADTVQMEWLGHPRVLHLNNFLEAYYQIIIKKPDYKNWWCIKIQDKEMEE